MNRSDDERETQRELRKEKTSEEEMESCLHQFYFWPGQKYVCSFASGQCRIPSDQLLPLWHPQPILPRVFE